MGRRYPRHHGTSADAVAMFDDRMRFLAVSRRFLSDFELGETVKVIGRSPARPLLRSLETLSGALMSASGRSQPIKTYSSETSGRESMSRRWRAPSSRIWQILSALIRLTVHGPKLRLNALPLKRS